MVDALSECSCGRNFKERQGFNGTCCIYCYVASHTNNHTSQCDERNTMNTEQVRCKHTEGKKEWPYVRRCVNDTVNETDFCEEHQNSEH